MKIGPVVIERPGPGGSNGEVRRDLREILADHDVVNVDEESGVIVVAPSGRKFSIDQALVGQELGSAGTAWRRTIGGEDYNLALSGHQGLEKYDVMRRSDGTVRQSLRIAKTPVLAGRWFVESYQPGDEQHDEIKEFIEGALFKWQSASWFNILTETLLMLDFGHYTFEKVFTVKEVPVSGTVQTKAIWKKWGPRHPLDEQRWEYDSHGGVNGGWFNRFDDAEPVFIPIEKLMIFTYDREAGNIEGISLLRSAYKHWYYKDNLYKIDAIQKERHGIGIPIIKLPPNYTPKDKSLANELARNLRTNERAHVVLPPMWELEFADLKGKIVDIGSSIEHHDNALLRNVLANFVGTETSAAATVQVELFLKATRFIADIIADVVNKFAIPELVDFNYSNVEGYPKLGVRRIGETADWRTLSFAIRNFIGADVLEPDDPLEEWVRKEMDLPHKDPDTTRVTPTPQSPGGGQAGPPRQGPPSSNQGAGTGNDQSGG